MVNIFSCLQRALWSIPKVWWLHRRWVVSASSALLLNFANILQHQLHKGKHYYQINIIDRTFLQHTSTLLDAKHFHKWQMSNSLNLGLQRRERQSWRQRECEWVWRRPPRMGGGRRWAGRQHARLRWRRSSLHLHSSHPHSTVETLPSYYWVEAHIRLAFPTADCVIRPTTRSARPARGRQWCR